MYSCVIKICENVIVFRFVLCDGSDKDVFFLIYNSNHDSFANKMFDLKKRIIILLQQIFVYLVVNEIQSQINNKRHLFRVLRNKKL